MSGAGAAPRTSVDGSVRRRALRWRRPGRPGFLTPPSQGFSALIAFLLLMGVVGIAVADARRTLGPASGETDFIAWLTVVGGLVGYGVARSSLSLASAHLVGAAVGTIAILAGLSAALTGTDVVTWPDPAEIGRRMTAVWDDLMRLTLPPSADDGQRPWGFAMLVLGALCWTTAQFGAMSIFRHGRATPAISAAGILLFLDILVPSAYRGLDPVLVAIAFAGLSLFLLVRLHLAQQQTSWARRSVVEASDVGRVFLGAGALFVVLVTVATTTLTTFAVAERGSIPWQSLAQPFEGVRQQLLRMLEGLGVSIPPARPEVSLFSSHQEIPERWQLGEGTAFRADTQTLDPPYWFGAAFDTFTRRGYRFTGETRTPIETEELPYGDLEIPTGRGERLREQSVTTISPEVDGRFTLLGPATSTGLSTGVRGRVLQHDAGGDGIRVGVELDPASSSGDSYQVTSSELSFGTASGALAADDLRSSRRDYAPGLRKFLQVDRGLVGPEVEAFVRRVKQRTRGRDNPYDIALHVQDTLRGPGFAYETDMTGVCGDRPAAECLLATRKGFCSYYATTMAVVLRELDIPTRLVHGYLPGLFRGEGRWEVPLQAAHAWVEVWFEGFGWVRFDPTPDLERFGGIGTRLPEGGERGAEPSSSGDPLAPSPSPEVLAPSPSPEPLDEEAVPATTGGGGPDLTSLGLVIAAVVLAGTLIGGALALFLVRRLPGGDATLAYPGIVRLASRLGHGPAPSQTELEYVSALGETLPSVTRDLELVAKVHVQAVYGRRGVAHDAIAGLRQAYARVRTALLRLLIRR